MRDSDLFPLFGRRHTTYLVCPLIAEGYTRLHKQSQIINLTSLVACGGSLGCTLDAPPHIYQSPPGASAYLTAGVITGSTRGCRNYGVYAAGVTGLWSGWCVGLVPMVLLFWGGRWAYNQGSHVVL